MGYTITEQAAGMGARHRTERPVVRRERVTWTRWDARRLRNVTSRPWGYMVTEPDGYERFFTTRREADAWITDNYGAQR
jgi:hypothetical protein